MFTQCSQCHTVFRIYAEQLTQAHGRVRCGICDQSFNALENLSEYLDNFAAPSSAAPEAAETVEHEHIDHTDHPAPAEPMAAEASFEPPPEVAAPAQPLIVDEGPESEPPPLTPFESENAGFTAPWENAAVKQQAAPEEIIIPEEVALPTGPDESTATPSPAGVGYETITPPSSQTDSALPDLGIIAAEPRRVSATEPSNVRLKATLWAATNIALILVLLGQYAYFNRNDLSQYPELRPWLTRFCAVVSCNTPLRRDVSHISLANRVVQSHPNQPNALLIDATLVNEADFPQPFPLLEIRFSDLSNQLVAGRRFRPSEYLPGDTSLQAGMPPHQPVHITLAIVDPGKEAVSFQFELL